MRAHSRVLTSFLSFFLYAATGSAYAAAPERPALLVVISIDQMRADYLDRFAKEFEGGFARLLKEGAVFTHARHTHVPTETCPGHAVILTGRTPNENGIAGNQWWVRDSGKEVYCVEDPVFGLSPLHLLTPTLGDALKATDPLSKVASFSEKDRAAILLGGRKADAAIWYDDKTGTFTTSRYYGMFPRWLGEFNQKRVMDRHYEELHPSSTLELQSAPTSYYEGVVFTPFSDIALEKLILQGINELKLGQHPHPDLLAISFSATDQIGHAYGPYSPQMHENILSLDTVLGELFLVLDRQIGQGQYAVILTADHGVAPTPDSPEGKAQGVHQIKKDDLIRDIETILRRQFPSKAGDRWVLDFSPPNLYLNRALISKSGVDGSAFLTKAAETLKTIPEIAEIFTPDQLNGLQSSDSTFAAAYRRGWLPSRSGDLLIRFKENILYIHDASVTGHGTPYDYDARVPLIFMGSGIKPGQYDAPVPVTDLAPTAAKLLGLDFPPSPESRVLNELFSN